MKGEPAANHLQMRTYVFVDAENHFLRSIAVMKRLGGEHAAKALSLAQLLVPGITGFPRAIESHRFGWNPELQLFWDCHLLSAGGALGQLVARVDRAVYACSCAGDESKAHEMRVKLRSYEFEPIVVTERKNLRKRRESSRERHGLIEKPKGCDIALVTRMVADAAADLYDTCLLFTSDADFLPAIEAVRRMGKVVCVFGYGSALPKQSPYLYMPDRFVDLEPYLEGVWRNEQAPIRRVLTSLTRAEEATEDRKR